MEHIWPLVVIGCGAAGSMAALTAARKGVSVLVLETRKTMGAKIRVSGGGRCNVLPSQASFQDYHTQGSHFSVRNMLATWPLEQVKEFFEKDLGVPLKTEHTGKMFPVSDDSRDVVEALHSAMLRAGVQIRFGVKVVRLEKGFKVHLEGGETVHAQHVILATGGLSMPKTGSDGAGWAWVRAMGHSVHPTFPALVPLLTQDTFWHALAGVSLPVRIDVLKQNTCVASYTGDFLFTHRGFSGPVVLDASRHFTHAQAHAYACHVSWGAYTQEEWHAHIQSHSKGSIEHVLKQKIPKRMVQVLCAQASVDPEHPVATFSKVQRHKLVQHLTQTVLSLSGSEGYKTAEVTAGGVPLEEMSTKTLESKRVPGMFFAGEICDVTGRLGGYNFLWAWVSGRLAGESVVALKKYHR
jgi:predicted Rossmann fold flavoprotein